MPIEEGMGFHRFLLWAGFIAWASALAWVGVTQRFDFWDGFEYLSNARLIAGQADQLTSTYFVWRAPLLPLLYAPLQPFLQACGRSLWQAHLLSVLLAAAAVGLSYRLFRASFGPWLSLAGASMVAANSLVIHYAPFVMADVPSMAFALLALLAWQRARQKKTWASFGLAGMAAGLCVAIKFPMMFFLAGLALFEFLLVLIPGDGHPRWSTRLTTAFKGPPWAGVISLVVFALTWLAAVAAATPREQLNWQKLGDMAGRLVQLSGEIYSDPWYEYPETMWLLLGPAVAVCFSIGVLLTLYRRQTSDLLHVSVIVAFVGCMTWRVGHKEARYLLPVVPSLVFIGLRGAEAVSNLLRWQPLRALGLALLVAVPFGGAAGEFSRFLKAPLYTQSVVAEAMCFVREKVGDTGRWMPTGGRAWSLFSTPAVAFPHDEYMHFHHFNGVGMEYLVNKKLSPYTPVVGPGTEVRIEVPPTWWETANASALPAVPEPLRVGVTHREVLALARQTDTVAHYGTGQVSLGFKNTSWVVDTAPTDTSVEVGEGTPPSVVTLVRHEDRVFGFLP